MNIKHKIISTLIFCTLAVISVNAQRSTADLAYKQGEVLRYSLYYGFIDAGEGELSVHRKWYNGKEHMHAKAKFWTVGMVKAIYQVNDVYESIVDYETLLPAKAIRNISENKYRYYNEVIYDRDSSLVHSLKSGRVEVPEGITDMVYAFYQMRCNIPEDIQIGDSIKFVTYFSDEIYPLLCRYKGIKKIKTKMGKFECLAFAPVTEVGRVFKTEEDMFIYLSNDKNHVPLQIKLDIAVGSFKADLVDYRGLKYPINYKK